MVGAQKYHYKRERKQKNVVMSRNMLIALIPSVLTLEFLYYVCIIEIIRRRYQETLEGYARIHVVSSRSKDNSNENVATITTKFK